MPFVEMNVQEEIQNRRETSRSFKEEWDKSVNEYQLIGDMISLRKNEKVTQSQLAAMTGNKQQVISRIEKRENSPTLKTFCNIINALGYELQIVKRG